MSSLDSKPKVLMQEIFFLYDRVLQGNQDLQDPLGPQEKG